MAIQTEQPTHANIRATVVARGRLQKLAERDHRSMAGELAWLVDREFEARENDKNGNDSD